MTTLAPSAGMPRSTRGCWPRPSQTSRSTVAPRRRGRRRLRASCPLRGKNATNATPPSENRNGHRQEQRTRRRTRADRGSSRARQPRHRHRRRQAGRRRRCRSRRRRSRCTARTPVFSTNERRVAEIQDRRPGRPSTSANRYAPPGARRSTPSRRRANARDERHERRTRTRRRARPARPRTEPNRLR